MLFERVKIILFKRLIFKSDTHISGYNLLYSPKVKHPSLKYPHLTDNLLNNNLSLDNEGKIT